MNGVHDMGGMDGFGKVEPEPNEPMFHEEWESRVLAMVRAMGAAGAFYVQVFQYIDPGIAYGSSTSVEAMTLALGHIKAIATPALRVGAELSFLPADAADVLRRELPDCQLVEAMRPLEKALARVRTMASWPIRSSKVRGRYLRASTV